MRLLTGILLRRKTLLFHLGNLVIAVLRDEVENVVLPLIEGGVWVAVVDLLPVRARIF